MLNTEQQANIYSSGTTFGRAVDQADRIEWGSSIKVYVNGEVVKELVNPTAGDLLLLKENSEKVVEV